MLCLRKGGLRSEQADPCQLFFLACPHPVDRSSDQQHLTRCGVRPGALQLGPGRRHSRCAPRVLRQVPVAHRYGARSAHSRQLLPPPDLTPKSRFPFHPTPPVSLCPFPNVSPLPSSLLARLPPPPPSHHPEQKSGPRIDRPRNKSRP